MLFIHSGPLVLYANTCLQVADVATGCLDNHHQGLSSS